MSALCDIHLNEKFTKCATIIVCMVVLVSVQHGNKNGILCAAAPSPMAEAATANVAEEAPRSLEVALKRVAAVHRVDNLTRQYSGDTFNAYG